MYVVYRKSQIRSFHSKATATKIKWNNVRLQYTGEYFQFRDACLTFQLSAIFMIKFENLIWTIWHMTTVCLGTCGKNRSIFWNLFKRSIFQTAQKFKELTNFMYFLWLLSFPFNYFVFTYIHLGSCILISLLWVAIVDLLKHCFVFGVEKKQRWMYWKTTVELNMKQQREKMHVKITAFSWRWYKIGPERRSCY